MDNEKFYLALKDTIKGLEENKYYDFMKSTFEIEFKKYGLENLLCYQEEIDYRKIFLKIYYYQVFMHSISVDYDGKSMCSIEEDTTLTIMNIVMKKMDDTREFYKKYRINFLSHEDYEEALKKYDIL